MAAVALAWALLVGLDIGGSGTPVCFVAAARPAPPCDSQPRGPQPNTRAVGVQQPASVDARRRYGRRVIYLSSAALFLVASAACAAAPSIGVLIAFRALQGAAGAPAGDAGCQRRLEAGELRLPCCGRLARALEAG